MKSVFEMNKSLIPQKLFVKIGRSAINQEETLMLFRINQLWDKKFLYAFPRHTQVNEILQRRAEFSVAVTSFYERQGKERRISSTRSDWKTIRTIQRRSPHFVGKLVGYLPVTRLRGKHHRLPSPGNVN
jgi:hypothetical protein